MMHGPINIRTFHSSIVTQYSTSETLQKHNFTPMDAMKHCVLLNMFSFTTKSISKSDFHPEGDR